MALLEILHFPDPRLRIVAAPVETFDKALLATIDDMYETMYEAKGVGLAATQVNIHQQIFTMDVSEDRKEKFCVINPKIISRSGQVEEPEGCLSVPGAYDKVVRSSKIHITGVDAQGKPLELKAEGLMAICIQHEIDHLHGKLFLHHLSKLKQERIQKKLAKNQRRA